MKAFRKLVFTILASVFIIAFVFASIGSCKDQKVTIRFFHRFPDEPYNTFVNKVVADFEKKYPNIHVDIQSTQNDPYKEKIKVAVGANNAPDVFFSWSGEFLYQFVRENKVYDLTNVMKKDPVWKNSIMPSQLAPFSYHNKIYGTPFRVSVKIFFYNTQIFNQYNLKAPQTWQDLLNVCETLKKNNITPIAYGNQEKWPSCHYITTLNQKLVPDDVRVTDYKPENGGFTNPGYIKALNMYKQLLPYCNPNPNAITHEIARTNFATGKVAMAYLESIEIPYITPVASKDFQYGMFAFPDISDGKGNQGYITGAPEGFVISAATKHPKEAIAFLKYLTGVEVGKQEVQQIRWFNGDKGLIDQNSKDKPVLDVYNIMNNAKGLANWLDTDVNAQIVDAYLNGIQQLTDNEATSEQVMKSVRETAKSVSDSMKN